VNVQRTPGDLRDWFPNTNSSLLATLKLHCEWLNRLPADPNAFVLDLIANGVRCEKRGRYDDAVARLYRACEAVAQQRLQTLGFSEAPNGKVAFEKLPDALKNEWRGRSQDGIVRLGLQDDYLLLNTVSDELGMRFEKLGLSDQKRSPLNARNDSILAHGKSPISSDSFNALLEPLLSLVEQDRAALPAFPMLQS
jgi:CRISPR-associated protein (TIGR02710 family)